jgi:hypothetical protein
MNERQVVLDKHRYTFRELNQDQTLVLVTSLTLDSNCGGSVSVPRRHAKVFHDVLKALEL